MAWPKVQKELVTGLVTCTSCRHKKKPDPIRLARDLFKKETAIHRYTSYLIFMHSYL